MIFLGFKQQHVTVLGFMVVFLYISESTHGSTTSENNVKSSEQTTTNFPLSEGSGEINTEYPESKAENTNSTLSLNPYARNNTVVPEDDSSSTAADSIISTSASIGTTDAVQVSPAKNDTSKGVADMSVTTVSQFNTYTTDKEVSMETDVSTFSKEISTVSTDMETGLGETTGTSTPIESTVPGGLLTTTSLVVLDAPKDIKFLNQSMTSLVLTWLWKNDNIQVDNFDITVYEDDLIVSKFTVNTTDSSSEQYFYTIQDLSAGMCYNISVTAMLNEFIGLPGYSDQQGCTLPAPPSSINVTTLSNTSMEVIWEWGHDAGSVDSFVVMVTSVTGNTFVKEVNSTGVSLNRYKVDGLHYGTCYNISVKAVFRGLQGLAKYMTVATCTLPASPVQVLVSQDTVTANSFNVRWQWNTSLGGVDNFEITVCDSNNEVVSMEIVDNTSEIYNVKGVSPGSCFDVFVAAEFSSQKGSSQHASTCTVPAAPENITVLSQTTSSLNVTWNQLGGADSFVVTLEDKSTLVEVNHTTALTWYNIDHLDPGHCFSIVVIAVFKEKYGSPGQLIDETCTVPLSPVNVNVTGVTSTDLNITWNWYSNRGNVDMFVVTATPTVGNDCRPVTEDVSAEAGQENYTFILTGLTAGQCYNISVYSMLNEQRGQIARLVSCQYTKPAVPKLSFYTYSDGILTITLKSGEGFVDSYTTNVSCNSIKLTITSVKDNTFVVTGVQPGSLCTVFFTALRGGLYSETATFIIKTNETEPGPVSNLRAENISKNSIEVSWGYPEYPNGNITQYHVDISTTVSVIKSDSVSSSKLTYLFTELTPGTKYIIKVKAENGAGIGEASVIEVFTKETAPGPVDGLSLVVVSSNQITVQWNLPIEPNGNITNFTLDIRSDSDSRSYITDADDRISYSFEFKNLTAGTCYEIIVTAINSARKGAETRLNVYTNETAPGTVLNAAVTNIASRNSSVTWERPVNSNGIIVKYIILISRGSSVDCEQLITMTCVDCHVTCSADQNDLGLTSAFEENSLCPNRSSIFTKMLNFTQDKSSMFNLHLTDLVPASKYNISIYGHTNAGIGKGRQLHFTTLEDRPSTPVRDVKVIKSTSSSVSLSFLPPEIPNGRIVSCTVQYFYREPLCQSEIDTAHVIFKEVTIPILVNTSVPIEVSVEDLLSFWEYNFSIVASTRVGQGLVWSKNVTHITNQSFPGEIDVSSVIFTDITPYRVNISWSLPCHPNGIIVNYVIPMKKVSDSNNETQELIRTMDNTTSYVKSDLLPDTEYEFQVAAETVIGSGNFTSYKRVKTYTDVPYKPRNIRVNATGPQTVYVLWTSPELRTGPTNYTVTLTDTVNSSVVARCYTQGFTNTSCSVDNLDEYWNYTVEVTGHTVNGSNSSALPDFVQTLQAAPGPVRNINVIIPSDVTKPRTVNITWNPPAVRDRNGIITKYYISYSSQNQQVTEIEVSAKSTFYNNIHLIPQNNYTFEVFAVTVANGTRVAVHSYIPTGAPQRPEEGNDTLIKFDKSVIVSDRKKQIAIQLPLAYLCDTRNGIPDKWGVVVVSERKLVKDEPFWGSRLNFDSKRRMTYKSWNQVKNYDLYDAYIAKDFNVQPECPQNYVLLDRLVGRRKRAVKSSTFVVGEDGNCNGNSDKYCNGYLRPGQKYQVKVYVCTQGGCTETKYSDPIVTEAEPPSDLPIMMIIIGIASAVVMFGVTLLLVYKVAWKKKILCFKQNKAEEAGKENPGYSSDIEMTDIPYRLIKLANFPEYVQDLQRDSNLGFSEQYKAIRRLSPSHTTNSAEGQSARIKNRYTNILPFDHSRIKLLPLDDEEGSDYINANYMPGYHSKREYIAAQGPLQCTKDDFWRMTWEQNVSIIVMLTQCVERGRRKCESYWPETPHEPVYYGDIIVETDSESTLPEYVIRIMTMKLGQKKRKIKQIHFLKWPDFGCPETTWLLIDFVMAVRLYKPHDMQGPMIIHCSAGVGRTGTFIALDHLLYRMKEHEEVDIFNIVLEMRNYRPSMVQTEDQYIFIHECLSDYLCASDEDEELQQQEIEDYLAEALYENVPRR